MCPKEALEKYSATRIEPMHDLYRLYDHKSFCDFERRKGEVIHSSEFIERLQKINPLLLVQHQVNFPDDWGLYAGILGRLVYLSGFPKGWLTEFSYSFIDERNLPTEEKRGWRSVLLRLMAKGVMEWDATVMEFGHSEGLNSERWMIYTAPYRNHDGSQAIQRNLANEFEL